jgi:hypothetical protein
MLQWFFDDSGTHDGSDVVVWGGVVGNMRQIQFLEWRWNDLLSRPPNQKPPLKKFSSADCRACKQEFLSYSYAESLYLHRCFRSIIIDSGVAAVAFATDVRAWNSFMGGVLTDFIGPAERYHWYSIRVGCRT